MKKIYFLMAVLVAGVVSVRAQELIGGVIPSSKIPDIAEFITNNPYPTKATDSLAWDNDSSSYFKYKVPYYDTLSYEPLQLQLSWAHGWAHLNEQYYFSLYRLAADSVMDLPLIDVSWPEGGPYNPSYVTRTRNTDDFPKMNELEVLCEEMKEANTGSGRVRPRPYQYFPNQYYNGQPQKQNLNATGSYPSGHGYFRGLFGRCLEIVDPEHNEAIQAMLDEWLHCRLLKGAHWVSDLSAGEKLGKMAFDSAMTVNAFRALVYAAQSEIKAYRGTTTGLGSYEAVEKAIKRIENGQLIIYRRGKKYNAQGQRL